MTSVFDVARYITDRVGKITAMKLQKLVFYSAAWSLVWTEGCSLFEEDFQAWANGPVVPELYAAHRGMLFVDPSTFVQGNPSNLTKEQKSNIDIALDFYGEKSAAWLSTLTHQELPWLQARGDTPIGESSNTVIPKSSIYEYYSSL
ncbi:DUF4065 domain-containing protein [Asaia siamensis]